MYMIMYMKIAAGHQKLWIHITPLDVESLTQGFSLSVQKLMKPHAV